MNGSKPELRREPIIVVKATEHGMGNDLDRAVPCRGRGRPRQAGAALRYAFDSLMRPAFVVVGDVCHDGAAKVVFRQENEVLQALSPQASHEPFNVGGRIGGAVGDRDPLDVQDFSQPEDD